VIGFVSLLTNQSLINLVILPSQETWVIIRGPLHPRLGPETHSNPRSFPGKMPSAVVRYLC